jgi:hypothetical protein
MIDACRRTELGPSPLYGIRMKYLFRNLLIAAAPFLLRELFRRMDRRPAAPRGTRNKLLSRSQ